MQFLLSIKKKLFTFLWVLIFGVFSYVCIWYLLSFSLFSSLAGLVNDTFSYKLQYANNAHENNVVIIKIDDKSLDILKSSDLWMLAFDKWTYAEAIENIFEVYGASTLGIDIVFANKSVLWESDEIKLQKALEKYSKRVVIASRSDYTPVPLCLYSGISHGIIEIQKWDKVREFQLDYPEYDISNVCSEETLWNTNTWWAWLFALEVLQKYAKQQSPIAEKSLEKTLEAFKEHESKKSTNYISFFHWWGDYEGTLGYQSYSFSDILLGRQKTKEGKEIDLRDKIVLIWEVGTLIHDNHFTPIHSSIKMPGVEIHANIISTLNSERILYEENTIYAFVFFISLHLLLFVAIFYLWVSSSFILFILLSLGMVIFSATAFYFNEIYNTFHLLVSFLFSYIVWYLYRFAVTDKSKRELKKNFSRYVSPDIVHQITQDPKSVLTQGEKREMTIFFSDIEGFTSISEGMEAEQLIVLLNEYFSVMTRVLTDHKGTLDKYIWDAVMWFFNAPIRQENHSYYACMTALEQQKELEKLNIKWKKEGKWYPKIRARIWLHMGEAIHGNVWGVDTRLNYTAIGDSVNLASRLEGIGKYYGVYICVSEDVYEKQKDQFHFRHLDTIKVKWKDIAVKIYELIWEKTEVIPADRLEKIDRYSLAMQEYYKEEYGKAKKIFSENSDDAASNMMAKRCQDVQEGKIEIIQGVFTMESK